MRISIKIKPNSKHEKVDKLDERNYAVSVKAPAQEGKANQAVIEILADYFDIPKSQVRIASGLKSKHKIVEVLK